jgi:hypothetical protein
MAQLGSLDTKQIIKHTNDLRTNIQTSGTFAQAQIIHQGEIDGREGRW